jgi:diguanylate cyclase (GGDEF)-like protein
MAETKAKLLAVDDNESNLDILLRLLQDYDVIVALDGKSALDLLHYETPDVILLDIIMPGMDGYEVCARIKSNPRWRDIPVLFITAKTDETSLVRAYDVGGCDYVTKPFRSSELLARVRTQLEYRRAMEQLRHVAITDDLTGIYNRRAFFEAALRAFQRARERGTALGVLMLDLDHFKGINDRYGHGMGDQALRRFAETVRGLLLPKHVFGRLGGEEFALLAPGSNEAESIALAERVCQAVSAIRFDPPADDLSMTVSIGVAQIEDGAADLDALLREADDLLFQAKHDGRNRVRHIRRNDRPPS